MSGSQKAEIATVIENFLPELHHQKPLLNHHLETPYALQRCRTEAMGGGRVENCIQCGQWVVYVKPPFAGPKQVLSYLGRYTHRVAISNNRILHVNDMQITFAWRDKIHKSLLAGNCPGTIGDRSPML